MNIGCPSIAASASMPPAPHPSTPRPLIMVVCESVPTTVSGNATPSRTVTTWPRCSRFTWWQIPAPGGTTRRPSNACCAQRRSVYRSAFRLYSHSMLAAYAPSDRNRSTCTEWSMMRSAGTSGSTFDGSPPLRAIAERIAARSTTAGTPVRSCIRTRPGMNAMFRAGPGQDGQRPHVVVRDVARAGAAEQVLQQDLDGLREAADVAVVAQVIESVDVDGAGGGLQRTAGAGQFGGHRDVASFLVTGLVTGSLHPPTRERARFTRRGARPCGRP